MDYGEIGIGDVLDLVPGMNSMLAGMGFLTVVGIILLVVMLAAFYVVTAFKWQFIGRKSGINKDWMPFVPFARTVYKLSIVEEGWWKMFFLDGWWLYAWLVRTIIVAISSSAATFATVLVVLYLLCCLAYNVYWRFKFYVAHNIKPHLSLTVLVPFLGAVRLVWDYLIAFGRNYPFTGAGTSRKVMDVVNVEPQRDAQGNPVALTRAMKPTGQGAPWQQAPAAAQSAQGGTGGSVSGMSGMYAGQTLPLAGGDEMVIGRDNTMCNLIVDQNAEKVSRRHCGIVYNPSAGNYTVTDYSTNGTFVDGGSRLVANMPTSLARGTIIALGNRSNRFRLD